MSLRLPYVLYVALAGVLVGVLIAPVFRDDVTAGAMPAGETLGHQMMHGTFEVGPVGAPQIALSVTRDPMEGWNVTLQTANFTFSPERAGQAHVDGTGHAHLYIDGVKRARLYGPHFHFPDLAPGSYEISVSLSTNDHDYYVLRGARIAASQTITQPGPES